MDFGNLTPEQIEKAKACKTVEDLLALAKEQGCEITEERLEALAGGASGWGVPDTCPNDTSPAPDVPCDYI